MEWLVSNCSLTIPMARPTTITDDQILDAARQVFLERGITATTAEVAKRAGVAEGSIFKRWKTKQALFYAALSPNDEDPGFINNLVARVGRGDLQETLTEVGMQAIDFFRQIMPLIMMCWSNPVPGELPPPFQTTNPKPLRVLKAIAGFFEAEMKEGRLARRDAEVMARTYLGGIQQFALLELVSRTRNELPMPAEMFIRGLVNLMWNGVRPDADALHKENLR